MPDSFDVTRSSVGALLARMGVPEAALSGPMAVHSPITGAEIARVATTDRAGLDRMIAAADAAFRAWRGVPAPRRGELVRLFGEELRAAKADLGLLVTIE